MKTDGPVHDRSAAFARRLWISIIPLLIVISVETSAVRPDIVKSALENPLCLAGLIAAVVAAYFIAIGLAKRIETYAFGGSTLFIVATLAIGSAASFPVMLPSTLSPGYSLTASAVASSPGALRVASVWWPIALILATSYFIFISRRYAGKVSLQHDNQGFYEDAT